MNRNVFKVIMNIMFLFLVSILLSFPIEQAYCVTTIDDDTVLEFYWDAAEGNVSVYNVYLSTNGSQYIFIGTTSKLPTISTPYPVPIIASNGSVYQIKVEAKDPNGIIGPMSLSSDPVLCQLSYIITVTAGIGGTISPSVSVKVNSNASQTFAITPSTGYHVKDVKVDGKSVGALTTYTFTNVTSTHTIEATFEINTYTITATAGSGGTISPSVSVKVNSNASQTFAITPSTGYHVKDVKVDGKSIGALTTYTFTSVTSIHTIEATFEINTYTITATAGSGGTISPSGAINVNYNNSQVYTIESSTGYNIGDVKIDGKSVGILTTYTFSNVKEDHNIQATFTIVDKNTTVDYTITATAGVGGSISPSASVKVTSSASQTFAITPSIGYHVKDVKVDGKSVGALTTYTFTSVTSTHTIEATFEINTYTITATAGSGGTISPSVSVKVSHNANQKFAITPSTGYHVKDVKVDGKSIGALTTYTFTSVTSIHTIEATFEINTYTITATAGSGGTISPSGPISVDYGNNKTFTITPSKEYRIKNLKVDGVYVRTLTTYTFSNIKKNHTIQATFAKIYNEITTQDENTTIVTTIIGVGGDISPSGPINVNYDDNITFTIAPFTGYHIKDIKVDDESVGSVSTYTFTNVISDHTIEAIFEIDTYTITATAGNGGTISPSGAINVNYDNSQVYTIEPSTGYNIDDVKIDGKSVGVLTTYTFSNVKEDHNIQATFTIVDKNTTVDYTITATAGVGGSISPSASVKVTSSASQTFAITPSIGYHVKDVKVDGKSVGALTTYTFTSVTSTHTIEATFEINIYTITATAGNSGTISPSGAINVNYGEDKAFTLTPSTGYHVSDLKIDGKSVSALTTYTFSNVKEDHTIQATFAIIDYTIISTAGAGGNISPSGTVKVNSSDNQTFAITPSTGYHVKDVKVDGKSVGVLTTYTFTNITSAHTIETTFESSTYAIIATAGNGGTISPSGTIAVNYGENLLFNISQANDYHIADVKVDGQSVGIVSTYVFKDITQNHKIEVSFALNTYTIVTSVGDDGTISPSGPVMVNHGANQVFTITPSSWHHIVNVKVDGKSLGTISTYTFTNVTSNHIIEISFAIDAFAINAIAGSGGNISPSGSITVNHGDNKTFTINPSDGYEIVVVKVDGHPEGTITSYTFTNVAINHTIEASFARKIYTITASADNGGTITPSGIMTVEHGSNQIISIKPDEGHIISSIVVDGVLQTNVSDTYIFTDITSDHLISVEFGDESFVIKTKSGPHGFIYPAITSISKVMDIPIKYGETKLFTISPDVGYYVANVNVDGQSIGAVNTYTFSNVTSNHVLEATFELKTYIISVIANNGGTVTPSGTVSVNYSSNQTFTITPSDGYNITDVLVDGKSAGAVASYTFSNVTIDHKIEATFAINTYTINATANNGGTITPSGAVSVNYSSDQTFTITPSDGYHITDVLVDGKSAGAVASYTFSNVTIDHKIEATFAINTYTINATANNGGTITPSGAVSVSYSSNQTFTITPSDGYHVTDVLVDGKSVGAVATYIFSKITENHTIEANFAITEYIYTITASSGNGGTIVPSGEVKVKLGETQKFIMVPSDGYVIQDVRIDGQSMSTISKFVFVNVTSDHTIDIKFRLFGNPAKQSALLQNYPNPFNPETWIPYQLKEDSNVKISIYNIKGEFVRELNVGYKPSGSYIGTEKAAYWDGKNSTGERVASGIYFYTIQAGKFIATRRMIIVK